MSNVRVAGKYGKLTAVAPKIVRYLTAYLTAPLPDPPALFDYAPKVTNGFPMFLNTALGDCTIAGLLHLFQLAYAEVGEVFTCPTDTSVRSTYLGLTGGQDTGLVETTVLSVAHSKGVLGETIAAWAPVDIKNPDAMRAAAYAFGGLYLGVELPQIAETQFNEHEPWTLAPGDNPPIGGHCIVASGASKFGLFDVTWGAEDSLSWNWWKYYGSEAYVIIPQVFVEAGHGPLAGVDIDTLIADCKREAIRGGC